MTKRIPDFQQAQLHALKNVTRRSVRVFPRDAEQALLKLPNGRQNPGVPYEKMCRAYAETMAKGEWVKNGDTIVYDEDGTLVDGEARMRACVISGKPFDAFEIRGIKVEAVPTIQSGVRRSNRDALTIAGEPLALEVAGAWPIIAGYLRMLDTGKAYKPFDKTELTQAKVLNLTGRFPDIQTSAEKVRYLKGGLGPLGTALATAFHYLASCVDPVEADDFLNKFASAECPPDHPAAKIRRHIKGGFRMRQGNKLAGVIKAFNRSRLGLDLPDGMVGYNQARLGDDGGEAFPRFENFPRHRSLVVDVERKIEKAIGKGQAVPSEPEIELKVVSPAEAQSMLLKNGPVGSPGNREVRTNRVDQIARDMENDVFHYNGQPLKFSATGHLLDGQHRLLACIKSGKPFITAIVRGLDDAVFSTLDGGGRKAASHYARTAGIKDYTVVISVINLFNKATVAKWSAPTNLELVEDIERHASLQKMMSDPKLASVVRASCLPLSVGWTLYYMTASTNPEAANTFFDILFNFDVKKTHPIRVFHRYMIGVSQKPGYNPLAEKILMEVMTIWNLWRSDEEIERMPTVKSFPKLLP